jgi:hypothetical protein
MAPTEGSKGAQLTGQLGAGLSRDTAHHVSGYLEALARRTLNAPGTRSNDVAFDRSKSAPSTSARRPRPCRLGDLRRLRRIFRIWKFRRNLRKYRRRFGARFLPPSRSGLGSGMRATCRRCVWLASACVCRCQAKNAQGGSGRRPDTWPINWTRVYFLARLARHHAGGKPIIDNFLNELRAHSRAAFLRGRRLVESFTHGRRRGGPRCLALRLSRSVRGALSVWNGLTNLAPYQRFWGISHRPRPLATSATLATFVRRLLRVFVRRLLRVSASTAASRTAIVHVHDDSRLSSPKYI